MALDPWVDPNKMYETETYKGPTITSSRALASRRLSGDMRAERVRLEEAARKIGLNQQIGSVLGEYALPALIGLATGGAAAPAAGTLAAMLGSPLGKGALAGAGAGLGGYMGRGLTKDKYEKELERGTGRFYNVERRELGDKFDADIWASMLQAAKNRSLYEYKKKMLGPEAPEGPEEMSLEELRSKQGEYEGMLEAQEGMRENIASSSAMLGPASPANLPLTSAVKAPITDQFPMQTAPEITDASAWDIFKAKTGFQPHRNVARRDPETGELDRRRVPITTGELGTGLLGSAAKIATAPITLPIAVAEKVGGAITKGVQGIPGMLDAIGQKLDFRFTKDPSSDVPRTPFKFTKKPPVEVPIRETKNLFKKLKEKARVRPSVEVRETGKEWPFRYERVQEGVSGPAVLDVAPMDTSQSRAMDLMGGRTLNDLMNARRYPGTMPVLEGLQRISNIKRAASMIDPNSPNPAAVIEFQQALGLPSNGYLDEQTLSKWQEITSQGGF